MRCEAALTRRPPRRLHRRGGSRTAAEPRAGRRRGCPLNRHRHEAGAAEPRAGRPGSLRLRRCGDEGGATTLFVVLLVPVLTLAAVAASAVPQRLAAESSLRQAAHDIAALASSREASRDPVPGLTVDVSCDAGALAVAGPEAETAAAMCATVSGLGAAGVDVDSVRGYYTNVLHVGVEDGGVGAADPSQAVWSLCAADRGSVNVEAVYVAVIADWSEAGWAVSQVWPDGRRIGAQSLAVRNPVPSGSPTDNAGCEPARDAVNGGTAVAAVPGDPVVRHPLRAE